MFLPHGFAMALAMTIVSTLCWGSWANTYKLTKGYRFELFYWDYAIGIVLVSLVWALTLGSRHADGTNFLANVASADGANIGWALVGGVIFNIANLLLVAGIEMAGLAIAFPLAIGIALVVGVVLSYAIQPSGNPMVLGAGVLLAIVAVVFDGKAYGALAGERVGRLAQERRRLRRVGAADGIVRAVRDARADERARARAVQHRRVLHARRAGLVLRREHLLHEAPARRRAVGFSGFGKARAVDHLLGVAGGFVWGTGTVFNFVAASFVGVAISYAIGQAAPMVAAFWGVAVWREFKGAPPRAWTYLGLMFACYAAALAVLSAAYSAG